jgi:hypothetical protein
MRKSEYKAGAMLVDGSGHVFIHDGYVGGDGYGVLIGETCDGKIERASDFGNFCKGSVRGEASEEEARKFMIRVMNVERINHY